MAVPPPTVWVPSQMPLAPSFASVMLVANDKGDNEMILGLCTDLLVFALQLRKTSARRPSDEGAVWPVIASNGVPFLQMRSVGLRSTSGRMNIGIEYLFNCIFAVWNLIIKYSIKNSIIVTITIINFKRNIFAGLELEYWFSCLLCKHTTFAWCKPCTV